MIQFFRPPVPREVSDGSAAYQFCDAGVPSECRQLRRRNLPGFAGEAKLEPGDVDSAGISSNNFLPYFTDVFFLLFDVDAPTLHEGPVLVHPTADSQQGLGIPVGGRLGMSSTTTTGEICLRRMGCHCHLFCRSSSLLTVPQVLLSISSLLTDPNFDDPLNGEARDLWRSSKEKYETKARTSAKQAPKNPLLTKGDGAASAGKKLSKKRSAELEEEKSAKKAKK